MYFKATAGAVDGGRVLRVGVAAVSTAWVSGDATAAMVMTVALVSATLLGTASASPAEGIQPLSKIAVHMATVEMQPSAYVRATPSLLGEQVHTRTPYVHHAGTGRRRRSD